MRTVRDIPALAGIPVLVRAGLNTPVEGKTVINNYRLRRAAPTLEFLAKQRAKVIVISHLGEQGTETLEPVARALGTLLPGVSFSPDTIGPGARAAVRALHPGNILVLENLRRNAGETGNRASFVRELAALADVFVQDAFDTCHRAHASIVGVPALLPSYAGLLLADEIRELSRALTPEHASLAVIGGAKFSTKETVIRTLLERYDRVFVGGALASDFLKASGHPVGKSLVSGAEPELVHTLLNNQKLMLPVDALVAPARLVGKSDTYANMRVSNLDDIRADEVILDIGPATDAILADVAATARNILWNGPLGKYEDGFTDATDALARAIATSSARSVVGGGDTVASIERLGLMSRFSFVSTGGGAMLDFLAQGTLPGIDALRGHESA